MSADNWAMCPKCERLDREKFEQASKDATEAYGKEPQEEYLARLETLKNWPRLTSNLREDYDLGISSHVFRVSYSASCSQCKFKYSFSTYQELEDSTDGC